MRDLNFYDYHLPENLIAKEPAKPRDCSKILIYDTRTDKIVIDKFLHIDCYLPKNSFLVLNKTRVVPARVTLYKENQGKVKVLIFVNEPQINNSFKAFVDRKVSINEKLYFDNYHWVTVTNQKEKIFYLKPNFSQDILFELLNKQGKTPIPHYIKNTPLNERLLRQKYQTVFADKTPTRWNMASVAAPTASLHFSQRVFKNLTKKDIKKCFITLYVGRGTFAPINEQNIKEKKLHQEWFEVNSSTLRFIDKSIQEGKKLVAVGTTVTRMLESIKNLESRIKNSESKIINSKFNSEFINLNSKFFSKTDLFIYHPYHFKMVDHLITNFHLPKTSLMMLVDAFLKFKKAKKNILDLYQIAIKEKFRFYSFGDAMMIF